MVNYPNQPFNLGDPFTPDLAYLAFNVPIFDDQPQYLGHRARLLDSELSNATGQIKDRVNLLENGLKVSVFSGRTLQYNSGIITLPDDTLLTIAAGQIVAPDNATSTVYLDPTGAVKCDIIPTVIRAVLARVTVVAGNVTGIQDLRYPPIVRIRPAASAVKVFGGSNSTDKVAAQNEIFDQGLYYYRNFTVPAGVSITVSKFARFYCSGNVDIQGTINVTQAAGGATGYQGGTVPNVLIGGLTGNGAGAGSGSGASALAYNFAAQPFGSGGGLGYAVCTTGNTAFNFGNGGDGGGGIWIEAAGTLTVGSSASIFAKGSNAANGSIAAGFGYMSGSGGGSGGLIYLSSLLSVTSAAGSVLDVRGGNGGNGVNNSGSNSAAGGSGGGGGFIVCSAPSVNTTGASLLTAGGTGGTYATSPGGNTLGAGMGGAFGGNGGSSAGGPGGGGRQLIRIFAPLG